MKVHKMTKGDFEKLDKKYEILNYIVECSDIFDSLTEEEMVRILLQKAERVETSK